MAEALELPAELDVVEHLAVVQELERAVLAREGLPAPVAEIDDREPGVAERDAFGAELALSVRAAVAEAREHRACRLDFRRPPE